ncbi:MAG TPA: hypothetical protein QF753_11775 [Victivallales bacterium]|nr:hypothetical protein [Victivallales bacterium]
MKDTCLFKPIIIGKRTAPNRFVANPLEMNCSDINGAPSELNFKRYNSLAKGKWGVVFVESTTASQNPECRFFGQNGLLINRKNKNHFRKLVSEFKEINNDSLLLIQLGTGNLGLEYDYINMNESKLEIIKQNLIDAGIIAAEVGFDGIDIKQAHGTLTANLLESSNKRKDKYSGKDIESRTLFFKEIFNEIRKYCDKNDKSEFLIGSRISVNDIVELKTIISFLDKQLKLDFISISSMPLENTLGHEILRILNQISKSFEPNAKIIGTGHTDLITNYETIDELKNFSGNILAPDLLGFGRQNLADPLLPLKIFNGRNSEINKCTLCNNCINKRLAEQKQTKCTVY